MIQKPLLLLVDGSSYLYRAFHALPPLNNAQGQPTGAIYGVLNMLRRLLTDYAPEYVAVIFDSKGKTFRDDLYADYKATRAPMPDDLKVQIEPLHRLIRAMGLPLLMIDGVEADDVIGTLAVQAREQGIHTLISTGDKDMAQLVDDYITLINTMNNTVLDSAGVLEKFGVAPNRIIDYLALMGDKVDNVPGVMQCGPKTAVKWLQQYDSLDGVIAHAAAVSGKAGENLRAACATLPLSKQLVTIKTDVALPLTVTQLVRGNTDTPQLAMQLREQGFKTWLAEVEGSSAPQPATATHHYHRITTAEELQTWLTQLRQAPVFAFDTETTSLNYIDAEIVGVSFCTQAGVAAYVPLAHRYLGVPEQLDRTWVLAQLKPILEDASIIKVGQHIKYDMNVLRRYDITLRGVQFDTMLESYCLNSVGSRHDMGSLAQTYLNKATIAYEDVAGKGAKQVTFDHVSLEAATEYAAEDADITLQLHQTLWPLLSAETGPSTIFQELEMPLVPILSQMEMTGVLIDSHKMQLQSQRLAERMAEWQAQAFVLAGEAFNLESPKQLQEILFQKLGLPILKKTPTGQPSTAEPILQELALEYELPQVIMGYRTATKLKSTYTDKLPLMVNASTGRIHTSYHQAGTATGRLSSSDPNLQNIPVRTEEGRAIRSAFIAPSGYKIMSVDYSQIELRIMAELSQDPGLLNAFEQGLDIHQATAAEVFGVPLTVVTSDQRRHAKAINFGLIYGMSAFGLAKQIGAGRHEAQQYIDIYFKRYPGVLAYMERARAQAREHGYVETLRGRRLYIPEINSRNKMQQMAAERVAINAPMQGTAADIIKQAMLDVATWISTTQIDAKLLMQVHDELVLEVAESAVATVQAQLPAIMIQAARLQVPMQVSLGVGDNWDEAH